MQMVFPNDPQIGDKFGTSYGYYEWDGNRWLLSRVLARKTVTSGTPPANGQIGQLWWDTVTANLYIFCYNTWVPVGSCPKSYPELPEDGLHVLETDGQTAFWRIKSKN